MTTPVQAYGSSWVNCDPDELPRIRLSITCLHRPLYFPPFARQQKDEHVTSIAMHHFRCLPTNNRPCLWMIFLRSIASVSLTSSDGGATNAYRSVARSHRYPTAAV